MGLKIIHFNTQTRVCFHQSQSQAFNKTLHEREGLQSSSTCLRQLNSNTCQSLSSPLFGLLSSSSSISPPTLQRSTKQKNRRSLFKASAMVLRSLNLYTILLSLAIVPQISQSLHFELQSGRTKCISEDIKSNSMTVGKYTVVNPNEAHPSPQSQKISIRVTL